MADVEVVIEVEMRACISCQIVLPITKYKKRGGRQAHTQFTMCNRCLYLKYDKPLVERKTKLIREYKLEQGCTDCGYNSHPAALHFDHLPDSGKLFNVGEEIGNRSLKDLWAEIAKCEVVCANCHAIRTQTRREALL